MFAVHIEPLQSGNLPRLNYFFDPKGVWFREVTLYIWGRLRVALDPLIVDSLKQGHGVVFLSTKDMV